MLVLWLLVLIVADIKSNSISMVWEDWWEFGRIIYQIIHHLQYLDSHQRHEQSRSPCKKQNKTQILTLDVCNTPMHYSGSNKHSCCIVVADTSHWINMQKQFEYFDIYMCSRIVTDNYWSNTFSANNWKVQSLAKQFSFFIYNFNHWQPPAKMQIFGTFNFNI